MKPSELMAPVGFAPADWQTCSAHPERFGGAPGWVTKPPIGWSDDLRRIIALPRRPRPTDARAEALIEYSTSRFQIPRAPGTCRCAQLRPEVVAKGKIPCLTRLRIAQAWALHELTTKQGLLGSIGVGHGKTVLEILAPLAMPGCRVALLLVPSNLIKQLIGEYELLAEHFHVPSIVVHGEGYTVDRGPSVPVLNVLTYNRLSLDTATTFLENLRPDFVECDEVDNLRNPESVRAGRILRYYGAHEEARFAGWTGSLTDDGIDDFAHLSALALRYGSPVPLLPEVVEDWGRCLNAQENAAPPGALMSLCGPGENVSDGFRRRLMETEGFVIVDEASSDVPIRITERAAPKMPPVVKEALTKLRGEWVRPDGEVLVEALEVQACAVQLACGVYYRFEFPRGEPRPLIDEWFEARKEWRSELRKKFRSLDGDVTHFDSPDLLTQAARRAWGDIPNEGEIKLPEWRADAWPRWRDVKSLVLPVSVPQRLHPFLAEDAAQWALEHTGIVWYDNVAFGSWVAEISGLPMHGGGSKAEERINAERGDRSIIASIKSHGRGRDRLQYKFREQLIANPPSTPTQWEQLLGRLNRTGQVAELVTAEFYRHTPELRAYIDTALMRGSYVRDKIGVRQKLHQGFAAGGITIDGAAW